MAAMKRSKAALVMLVLLVACMSNNASPTPTSSSATFDPDAFRALACDEVARGFATLRKDVKLPPAVLLAQLQSDTPSCETTSSQSLNRRATTI
jgi:hypothetical protein